MGMPDASARWMYSLSTGTTSLPSGTASEPPGQKSFCTSTTISASAIGCLPLSIFLRARLGVEAIEPRRAVLADHLHALRRLDDARQQQFLAEVALVQGAIQDGLVDLL